MMSAGDERALRQLLRTVPPERQLQARAAMSGAVEDLAARIRSTVDHPDSGQPGEGWQARLSAQYMLEFAALHRPPDEVAAMDAAFGTRFGPDSVLGTAAERSPGELAAIASELPEPGEFIRKVTLRRRARDIAAMLTEMGRASSLLRKTGGYLCSCAPPATAALVALHLRGMEATAPLFALLENFPRERTGEEVGEFILWLAQFSDEESRRTCIASTVTWRENEDVVGRVAAVVTYLLQQEERDLANEIVTAAIDHFDHPEHSYRLYALLFVFREFQLDDEVVRIADKISETARGDNTGMIIRFCSENRENAGELLRIVLREPKPAAAVRITKESGLDHSAIFETIAAWPCQDLREVEHGLSARAIEIADEFRNVVTENAAARPDGTDIGDIVLWFLSDVSSRENRKRISRIIETSVARDDPDLLVAMILRLRTRPEWWSGRKSRVLHDERPLRDEVAHLVESYDITQMLALIRAAEDRCLPSVHRMSIGWLSCRVRSDDEIVSLIRALKTAGCGKEELRKTVEWSAVNFHPRPDGGSPARALESAGLAEERKIWSRVEHRVLQHRMLPKFKRPDPEPPRI